MDTSYLISAVLLASAFCLAMVIAALLYRKNRPRKAGSSGYRLYLAMGAVMVTVGVLEILVLWRWDLPFIIALPLLAIGLIFLLVGLGNLGRPRGG